MAEKNESDDSYSIFFSPTTYAFICNIKIGKNQNCNKKKFINEFQK